MEINVKPEYQTVIRYDTSLNEVIISFSEKPKLEIHEGLMKLNSESFVCRIKVEPEKYRYEIGLYEGFISIDSFACSIHDALITEGLTVNLIDFRGSQQDKYAPTKSNSTPSLIFPFVNKLFKN